MAKISMEETQKIIERVAARWGDYIPDELRKFKAKDIFRFHSTPDSFNKFFELTFESTFKKANNLTCPAQDIGDTCGGFVTAHLNHSDRRIHINPANLELEFDAPALVAHEYIHWLSHKNFYPIHYRKGGNAPFQVEGITEWLMLNALNKITDGVDLKPLEENFKGWFDQQKWRIVGPGIGKKIGYVAEYEKTQAWLWADKNNFERMMKFIFQGEITNLESIHP